MRLKSSAQAGACGMPGTHRGMHVASTQHAARMMWGENAHATISDHILRVRRRVPAVG